MISIWGRVIEVVWLFVGVHVLIKGYILVRVWRCMVYVYGMCSYVCIYNEVSMWGGVFGNVFNVLFYCVVPPGWYHSYQCELQYFIHVVHVIV